MLCSELHELTFMSISVLKQEFPPACFAFVFHLICWTRLSGHFYSCICLRMDLCFFCNLVSVFSNLTFSNLSFDFLDFSRHMYPGPWLEPFNTYPESACFPACDCLVCLAGFENSECFKLLKAVSKC